MKSGNGHAGEVARYLAEIGASCVFAEDLVMALTRRAAGEAFDVDGLLLQPDLLQLVPESLAFENRILPVHRKDGILFVAVPAGKPPDDGIDELEHLLGLAVEAIPVGEIDVAGILVKAHQLLRRRARTAPAPPAGAAPAAAGPSLAELGMPAEILKRLLKALSERQGLVLITGPAGSGKSTTLAAIVKELRRQKLQAAALDGRASLAALEEALRGDPDALALDEPASPSAAARALRAAVEGRLVVIAQEAADAAGAVARLEALKVDGHLLATALRAGLNQRLLRRVCAGCREEYVEEAATLEDLRLLPLLQGVPLRRGKGCDACGRSGHEGHVAVFEYGDASGVRSLRGGFQPLVADALGKLLAGLTTLRELADQVPFTQILQAADRLDVRRV
ncbi:MAG: Flp pilus assembly complex ATPase component TadA [Planctomycetes bacterium]|nr:Flp pilus assembly complex ATPase component TadA [Planctomycetota bacterium]